MHPLELAHHRWCQRNGNALICFVLGIVFGISIWRIVTHITMNCSQHIPTVIAYCPKCNMSGRMCYKLSEENSTDHVYICPQCVSGEQAKRILLANCLISKADSTCSCCHSIIIPKTSRDICSACELTNQTGRLTVSEREQIREIIEKGKTTELQLCSHNEQPITCKKCGSGVAC
jgi:hypothetical protein